MRFSLLIVIFCCGVGILSAFLPSAQAQDDGGKRFASLGKDEVFVRTGPASQYPIKWIYKKSGFPIEIIREYDTWRQIKDYDGSVGWVHHAMLSSYRTAIITEKDGVAVLSKPNAGATAVVRLEQNVLVSIDQCDGPWCRVYISGGFKGWVPRTALWGIYPSEEIR